MSSPARRSRIEGGLMGLLIGDALGVPYEFHPKTAIPALELIEMEPPKGFARAHVGVAPATYSDDGAQALCLLASLLEHENLNLDDFGKRLCDWYASGYLAINGEVFDVGIQTSQAIRAMLAGVAADSAGPSDVRANGNGSLMRVLPLALFHRGTDESLVLQAHRQSLVTHGHIRSHVCCALYVLWARITLNLPHAKDFAGAYEQAAAQLSAIYHATPDGSTYLAELEALVRPEAQFTVEGTGYVVDALRSAKWACDQGDYKDVVRAAISLGNDTDTTACIAGGIAGIRDGVYAIPLGWRHALRGRDLYMPLLEQLLARVA